MSRATIRRVLDGADLKPHRSHYWLNTHAADFADRVRDLCRLYLDAPRLWAELGELVLCVDEKTGVCVRQRKSPTRQARPGAPRRVEHQYFRRGMTQLTATFAVPTGRVSYTLAQTHNSLDFVAHLRHAAAGLPAASRYHWVLDNNRSHATLAVCEAVAQLRGQPLAGLDLSTGAKRRAFLCDGSGSHVFHFTPVHGSWLNQVELWFGVLSRRFLRRDDFASLEEFEGQLALWVAHHNAQAHPYRWTYAGAPLVRDTPFDRTRRQRVRGRAFLNGRPKRFQRLFDPPRPYRKRPAA
jgi:hypothetical protein